MARAKKTTNGANLGFEEKLWQAADKIGKFFGRHDGLTGSREPEFYTLSNAFIRQHHDPSSSRQKVRLKKLEKEIEPFKNGLGFELIAERLGILRPAKWRKASEFTRNDSKTTTADDL